MVFFHKIVGFFAFALLLGSCSAFLAGLSKDCLLLSPKSAISLQSRSCATAWNRRNTVANGVTGINMMASPLKLRARLSNFLAHCGSKTRKILTAAVVAGCLSSSSFVKPAIAKSAAELAMEVDQEADSNQVEIEYTGMRKLTTTENAAKYGALIAVFGGATIWTYRDGKREDRDEEARVKAEVERIEQWKKEFIDMEDVVADDDLQAALSKRMSGEKADGVDDADGSGGVPVDYVPEDPNDGAGGEEEEKPASIDTEQLERLKRMLGGGGGDTPK